MRMAWTDPSTRSNSRSSWRAPRLARSISPQTKATNRAITLEKASAVSSGSTNVSLAWINAGGTIGMIGSNTRPAAWSSLKASTAPKRRTNGARAAAVRGPTRSNPISRS